MKKILPHTLTPLLVTVLALGIFPARGNLWWDPVPGTPGPGDGAGNWSNLGTLTNWWNGVADVAWNPGDTAVIGFNTATATTITLTNKMVVGGIIFSNTGTAGYTVAAASSSSVPIAAATNLFFTGASPSIILAGHDVTQPQVTEVISASVIATNALSVLANTTSTNSFFRFNNFTNNFGGSLYVGTPGNATYGPSGLFLDINTPTSTDPYVAIVNNLTNVTVYSNAMFRISNHNSGSPANILWPKQITISGDGRNGIAGAWTVTGNVGDNFVANVALAGDSTIDFNAGAANKVYTLYGVISGTGRLMLVSGNSTANRETCVLTNASTYVGPTIVAGGTILQLIGGNNRLPVGTALTLGATTAPAPLWNAYGRLLLGNSTAAVNQTVGGFNASSADNLCRVYGGHSSVISYLTVNSGASNYFAGAIGGSATADKNVGIILTGGGVLTLTGTNQANGGFTASSGTIEFGDGFTDIPLSGPLTNNSTMAFNVASSAAIVTTITGSGGIVKRGLGALTLTGTNDYAGSTTVTGGSLSLSTAKSGTGAIIIGNSLELDIKRHIAGAKVTAANATFDTDTVKMDFNLKGPTSTPMLDVTGTLANTGAMNIYIQNAGALTVGSYPLIKYGSFVDGGSSSFNLTAPISPRVTASIVNNTGGKSIDLVVTSVDFLKWSGATDNNWDTTTTNWLLTSSSSPITYSDGELLRFDDTGANTAINLASSASPGMITVTNVSATYSVSGGGSIGGSGSLVKSGSGSLTLALSGGANQSGGTIIQAGTLALGDGSTDCSATAPIEDDAALILNVVSANNPAAIFGTGSVTKQGGGSLTLNQANSYTGTTTINAGSVHVSNSSAFGTAASGTVVQSGAEVWIDADGLNIPEPLTIGGVGLGSAGALNIGDTMNSIWSGQLTLSADTLVTAGFTSSLTFADKVLGSGNALNFECKSSSYFVAASNVMANAITLGAFPTDVSAGGLILAGANDTLSSIQVLLPVAFGSTPPATGGLIARNNLALGTNSTVVLTNASHIGDTGARLSLDNNVTIPAGVNLVAWCPGNGTEGPGGYRCTLSVRTPTTNTFNGPITIHGVDPSLSATSLFQLYGGDAALGGGMILNGNITVADGAVTLFARGANGSGVINGVIYLGTNVFATADSSPWTIGSTGNTWAETQITGGGMVLNVGQNNALCTAAPVRMANGSPANALDLQGHNQQVAGLYSVTGTGMTVRNSSTNTDSTLKVLSSSGSNWVYSGTLAHVSGAKALHLDVAGDTLTLANGGNNYTGTTTIRAAAILALTGSGNITASPLIDVQAGGTFDVSGTTSGGWTVGAAQTLRGNGTVVGNLSVSGTVAPGASIGILNVTSNVTVNSSGTLVMEVNNSSLTNDLLNVTGTITYGGTLLVTNISGTPYSNGQVLKLFNAGAYSGSFVNISVPGASYDASNLAVNGTLTVTAVSTTPVSITAFLTSGGTALDLSWPADHTGWKLQAQTNVFTGSWSDVTGSTATNHMVLPVAPANKAVFFRLKSP
jgi:autotransporter-associated beta strand protein